MKSELKHQNPRDFGARQGYNTGQNVSAETSDLEQEIEHDAEWHRCDEEGSFFMAEIKKGIRALGYPA